MHWYVVFLALGYYGHFWPGYYGHVQYTLAPVIIYPSLYSYIVFSLNYAGWFHQDPSRLLERLENIFWYWNISWIKCHVLWSIPTTCTTTILQTYVPHDTMDTLQIWLATSCQVIIVTRPDHCSQRMQPLNVHGQGKWRSVSTLHQWMTPSTPTMFE